MPEIPRKTNAKTVERMMVSRDHSISCVRVTARRFRARKRAGVRETAERCYGRETEPQRVWLHRQRMPSILQRQIHRSPQPVRFVHREDHLPGGPGLVDAATPLA